MNEPESPDTRLGRRVRVFAEKGVAAFDAERVAAIAMAPRRRPPWQIAATVGSAILLVAVFVGVGSLLANRAGLGENAGSSLSTVPGTTAATTATPVATGLTEEQAIAAARAAVPQAADWSVRSAEAGPVAELLVPAEAYPISPFPPSDRWVWVIDFESAPDFGAQGSTVVLGFGDGQVYLIRDWIS